MWSILHPGEPITDVHLYVPKDADKAAIKRAFAAASKELHPDRYYGKDLGPFRAKLAKIFTRVAEAAEELQKDT